MWSTDKDPSGEWNQLTANSIPDHSITEKGWYTEAMRRGRWITDGLTSWVPKKLDPLRLNCFDALPGSSLLSQAEKAMENGANMPVTTEF
eukprot:3936235-Rhodomonas_salina.2